MGATTHTKLPLSRFKDASKSNLFSVPPLLLDIIDDLFDGWPPLRFWNLSIRSLLMRLAGPIRGVFEPGMSWYMIPSSRLQEHDRIITLRRSLQKSTELMVSNKGGTLKRSSHSFTASTKRSLRLSTSFLVAAGVNAGGREYPKAGLVGFFPRALSIKSNTSTCSSSSTSLIRELDALAVRKAEKSGDRSRRVDPPC